MGTFATTTPQKLNVTDNRFFGFLNGDGTVWDLKNLTYSFSDFDQWSDQNPIALSAATQNAIKSILDEIASVTELSFSEKPNDATLDFFQNPALADQDYLGLAAFPHVNGTYTSYTLENPTAYLLYHEILHSMGLDHPNLELVPTKYQSGQFTVMYPNEAQYDVSKEYVLNREQPTGLLAHDIEFLQAMYGTNQSSIGDTTYVFDTSIKTYEGLFDAGGNDTIRIVDAGKKGVSLDLAAGGGLDIGSKYTVFKLADGINLFDVKETVFTTSTTIIERAILADGNDFVSGNSADNYLVGHGGSDTILANDGNDQIWAGGTDNAGDYFDGGAGRDQIGGGTGNDTLIGGIGTDSLFGGAGNDIIYAQSSTDHSSEDNDIAWSGNGDDSLFGSNGSNTLGAKDGDDLLKGYGGNDTFFAAAGNDTIDAGTGNNIIYGGAGDDSITSGNGNDVIWLGAGNDTTDGGAGDDTIGSGGGNDIITTGSGNDKIIIVPDNGNKTVTDFDTGMDVLYLSGAGFTNLADVSTATSQSGNNLIISLGDGSVTLEGVSFDSLVLDANLFI